MLMVQALEQRQLQLLEAEDAALAQTLKSYRLEVGIPDIL